MKSIILISANSEWRAVKDILAPRALQSTPLGECFEWPTSDQRKSVPDSTGTGLTDLSTLFFHGGWGKVSAAASTQYVIDHYHPDVLINLGTCGGFEGRIERETIILVSKTIIYDIIEQMSSADEAIDYYATEIDLSWLREKYPFPVRRGLLLSADRDILPTDIPQLVEKYGAIAADWESGAIAWVAKKNGVRCLILRGVTDLVNASGGEAYNNMALFDRQTQKIMKTLIEQRSAWLALISSNDQSNLF